MAKPLRVLLVEDSEDDAFTLLRQLERGGYEPASERVETRQAMATALGEHSWDVILSDYSMPCFGGLDALALLKEMELDIPFIIVSGAIGEDTAVEAMKEGAHDYVMKRNLARLIPSIERELREAEGRRERQRAEESLRKSEALNCAILKSAFDSIITVDQAGRIIEFNSAAEEAFGHARADVLGKSMVDLIIPPSLRRVYRSGIVDHLGQASVLGKRFELSALRSDGTEFPVEVIITPVELGGPPLFTNYIRDITERRQAETELIASEMRFRRVVESDMIGIMFWDGAGNITEANEALLKIVGYTRKDLVAGEMRWRDLTPLEYESLDRKALDELLAKQVCTPFEKEFIRKDGKRVPVLMGAAILGSGGCKEHGVCFVVDLTDRQRAEETQNLLAAIVESSDDAIIGKTLDGTILSWNAGAERMYGYRAREVIGCSISRLIPNFHPVNLSPVYDKIKQGGRIDHLETVRMKKDGTSIDVALTISPIKDARGRIIGASAIERDITARKQEEKDRLKLIQELTDPLYDAPQKLDLWLKW
jgi:PAS domain S-box-containing protein